MLKTNPTAHPHPHQTAQYKIYESEIRYIEKNKRDRNNKGGRFGGNGEYSFTDKQEKWQRSDYEDTQRDEFQYKGSNKNKSFGKRKLLKESFDESNKQRNSYKNEDMKKLKYKPR